MRFYIHANSDTDMSTTEVFRHMGLSRGGHAGCIKLARIKSDAIPLELNGAAIIKI